MLCSFQTIFDGLWSKEYHDWTLTHKDDSVAYREQARSHRVLL